jgi:hypothetical protein
LQQFGDLFPRARFVLAVLFTNFYFALTAFFFARETSVAMPLFLHVITFGHYPIH